jgi:hypothetical protein
MNVAIAACTFENPNYWLTLTVHSHTMALQLRGCPGCSAYVGKITNRNHKYLETNMNHRLATVGKGGYGTYFVSNPVLYPVFTNISQIFGSFSFSM